MSFALNTSSSFGQVEEKLSKEAQEAGDRFQKGELSLSSGRQEEMLAHGATREGGGVTESKPEQSSLADQDKHDEL